MKIRKLFMHRLTIVLQKPTMVHADHGIIVTHYGYSDDFFENLSGDSSETWQKI